jgi:hypothetical protein
VYVVIRFWEPYTETGYTILIHGLIHILDYIRITILCYANIVMTRSILRQRCSLFHQDCCNNSRHAGRRPSRCVSDYSIPCIHQDPSRVSRTTRFCQTSHRQPIRFSTCRTELLLIVRQVPCRSRIQEHPMGPQALLQVDSRKETNDHHSTQR